jgi:hypothetical protein
MMVGVLFTFLTIGFIGCGSSVSEEQLAQLDALKKEVSSLEKKQAVLRTRELNSRERLLKKTESLKNVLR